MNMNYILRCHSESVLAIEVVAHLQWDEDFQIESLDDYAWDEEALSGFAARGQDRHCLFGLFDPPKSEPTGYVAYTINHDTGTFYVEKLESLRDDDEAKRLRFMLRWLILKARKNRIVVLTLETELPKIQVLTELGFIGELRKRAFSKMGRDGIIFTLTERSDV